MPRRIILHAGFHQTGTRRLQDALKENRVALKKQVAVRLPWHMPDLLAATRDYALTRDAAALTLCQDRFAALLDALPGMPRRSLILSSADLGGQMPGRGTVTDYGAAPDMLYAFWHLAHERFPNAEIMVFLTTRGPAPWLRAVYAHHLAVSKLNLSFDAFCAQAAGTAQLDAVAAEITSRVPAPVHTCAAETAVDHPLQTLDPLLALCDVPEDLRVTLTPVAPPPAPPEPDVLTALLEINRTQQNPAERRAAKDALLGVGAPR